MTDKKKDEVVLGPGAKDDAMAKKEAKVEEKHAETITDVTEDKK